MLPKKEEIRDKVVLVGLNSPVLREDSATEESMDELSALVETAGGETAGIVLQNRPAPDPRTFIGEAKVESVEYSETIDIVAVCPPKVLGQIGDYTQDWTPPKEDWE